MDFCYSLECIEKADISNITKKVYLERLKVIIQDTEKDIYEILSNPTIYIDWIKNRSKSLQTQKSYISAILALFKHTPGLKEKEKKNYYDWYSEFSSIHKQIEAKYKLNEPTKKQREAYVSYENIVKKRNEMDSGSKEKLLLSVYTYLPPLRSDFNCIYIYKEKPTEFKHNNYILLYDKPTLVLNEYKTVKKNDILRKELPEEFVKEIKLSIKKNPREWLFVDRENKPYLVNSFNKWANRTLKKIFGKPLTISLIRHSYINSLDFNKLTVSQKENIAKDMAHTVNTQDRYRLIF
jgi:hypothetical protein